MKNKRKINTILLSIIFVIVFYFIDSAYSFNFYANKQPDYLNKARFLVKHKQYKKSLAYYYKELAKKSNNSDLLIETARVEGWVENYRKSAMLYRQVLKITPNRRYDILRPLGWQLLWLKQPDRAEILFQEYLSKHPRDENANLGMARVFEEQRKYYYALNYYKWIVHYYPSNIDGYYGMARVYLAIYSYRDAEETYRKILNIKPKDRTAIAGIARSHNLSGKHRLAAKEYSVLLANKYQENEYRREFAYARYWAGFDELALQTLNGMPDKESVSLRSQILHDLGNPVMIAYDGGTDSDGLDIHIATLSAGMRFNQTNLLQGIVRVARLDQYSKLIYGKTFLLKWSGRYGNIYSTMGTHWPSIALGIRDYDNWQTFAWMVSDKWLLNDLLRVDIEAKNEPIENIKSIDNKIQFSSILGSIDYRFHPRALITGGARIGKFSDNNIRKDLIGRFMYTVAYKPRINIGAEIRYFTNSKHELNNGYYNPDEYSEYKVIAAVSHYFYGWLVKIMGNMGQLDEVPGPNGTLYQYEGNIEKDFKEYGKFKIYIGHSKSNPSLDSPVDFTVGYKRTYWGISYYFNF